MPTSIYFDLTSASLRFLIDSTSTSRQKQGEQLDTQGKREHEARAKEKRCHLLFRLRRLPLLPSAGEALPADDCSFSLHGKAITVSAVVDSRTLRHSPSGPLSFIFVFYFGRLPLLLLISFSAEDSV